MFESAVERTVIFTGIALWFAHGWYLNRRLRAVHMKLDSILSQFNGLREYLYEIDPQFNDERETRERFERHMVAGQNSTDIFAGADDNALVREKEKAGRRTLYTPLGSRP